MTIYDLVYLGLAPFVAPYLYWKSVARGKYRESGPAMMGRCLASEDPEVWEQGCIWVHAVSVGEAIAAKSVLPHLRGLMPGVPILLTTVTETGQAQARGLVPQYADHCRYFPLDFSWVVERFVDTYRPRMLVLMETELWPNVLSVLAARGVGAFVANGVISEKSHGGYMRLRALLRRPLSNVKAFCMQTQQDADRLAGILGDASRVHVTGNCKFDMPWEELDGEARNELRRQCAVGADARIVVAGSTHPGEEEIVLEAFRHVLNAEPASVLILVPRHPERFAEVWEKVAASGMSAWRLSSGQAPDEQPRVVLVDRMGLLSRLYAIADVALVAGSFVPGIGGHNILEPAVYGVPVVYGPYMQKQPDMVRILESEKAGVRCPPQELGWRVAALLCDKGRAAALGKAGRDAVMRNRGAAERTVQIIQRFV